jgi:hypothetical protein
MRWNDHERARLEHDRAAGMTLAQLGERYGVTRQCIRQVLVRIAVRRRLGLPYYRQTSPSSLPAKVRDG